MYLSDWTITEKGLEISCTIKESEELRELEDDKGLQVAEDEVLEHATCNGLRYVSPEEIGALTSATILTDDENHYSDFNYYQIKSFVHDLIHNQKAILNKV